MDPSALIFVALAVAWAVYLVPKALQHHDDAVRSRSVDRFSQTMRVLARREPVGRRGGRLVVGPQREAAAPVVTTKVSTRTETRTETVAEAVAPTVPDGSEVASQAPLRHDAARPAPTAAQVRARREAANRAARRRRNVLATILLLNVVVLALARFGVLSWWYAAGPAGLLVAWLVACRLMVKQERAAANRSVRPRRQRRSQPARPADEAVTEPDTSGITVVPVDDWTADTSSIPAAVVDPTLWDPVPVTLPTYVTKPAAARRTVRTIDLDSTGVWTSGRTEADSALAREAEQADQARKSQAAQDAGQRAVGS